MEDSISETGGFGVADLFPSVDFLHRIRGMRPKLERLHREAVKIMETIINEHKENRAKHKNDGKTEEDLVDVLLKFHDRRDSEFSLAIDNIKAVILVSICIYVHMVFLSKLSLITILSLIIVKMIISDNF